MASKIFNDTIHKQIELPPMCVKIVDTPQFQRLRHLKQMGVSSHVYPGANHTRFEHSIGVCHLAGKVVRQLQLIHGKDVISDQEAARVEIAGLCHDLGHGPMSHVFEKVIKHASEEKFHHEKKSMEMFELLINENGLQYDLETTAGSHALVLIEDIIHEFTEFSELSDQETRFIEAQRQKRFLYQIVANDDNGIDVDRWDYFARDSLCLGVNNYFQYDRIIPHMRICDCTEDGKAPFKGLAYRDKVKEDLMVMFRTRFNLHCKACGHRVVHAVEHMVCDAFQPIWKVKFITFPGTEEKWSMEDAIGDIKLYQFLDDRIVKVIQSSTMPELKPAQELFNRIDKRDFYACVLDQFKADDKSEATDKSDPKLDKVIQEMEKEGYSLLQSTTDYHYGQKDENPFNKIYFYSKSDAEHAKHAPDDKLPLDLPKKWRHRFHRLYFKNEHLKSDKKTVADLVEKKLEELPRGQDGPSTPTVQRSSSDLSQGSVRPIKGVKRSASGEGGKTKKKLSFN